MIYIYVFISFLKGFIYKLIKSIIYTAYISIPKIEDINQIVQYKQV